MPRQRRFVLFAAGIPLQSGSSAPNGQWLQYWKELFEAKAYLLIDAIRPAVWENDRVVYYYAQNGVLFVHREHVQSHAAWRDLQIGSRLPLRVIHPNHYLQKIDFQNDPSKLALLGTRLLVRALPIAVKNAVARLRRRKTGHA